MGGEQHDFFGMDQALLLADDVAQTGAPQRIVVVARGIAQGFQMLVDVLRGFLDRDTTEGVASGERIGCAANQDRPLAAQAAVVPGDSVRRDTGQKVGDERVVGRSRRDRTGGGCDEDNGVEQ